MERKSQKPKPPGTCVFKECKKPARSRNMCLTHYKYWQVQTRLKALRDMLDKMDKMKTKYPHLAPILDDISKDATETYRNYQTTDKTPPTDD